MRNLTLNAALSYLHDYNWSIIPVSRTSKKPLIEWKRYRHERPDDAILARWFGSGADTNIGVVTGELSDAFVVDCDSEDAVRQFERYINPDTPIPVSKTPRGGRHYWFRHFSGVSNRAGISEKMDIRTEGGYIVCPPSELPNGKYRWITPPDGPLPPLPDGYIEEVLLNAAPRPALDATPAAPSEGLFSLGKRDDTLFHIANCMIKSGCSGDEVAAYITELGLRCSPPFSKHDSIEKVKSALKRYESSVRNIPRDVKEYVETTDGKEFTVSQILTMVGARDARDRKNVYQTLNRLARQDKIMRCGSKDGVYRTISTDFPVINWQDADTTEYPIWLPLSLHKLHITYPGNIIMCAGSKNSGKSAFMCETVRHNMHKHDIWYYTSEMDAREMKVRMRMFRGVKTEDWKFNFCECNNGNYDDAIKPDSLNIIDYLDISDNFYRVGEIVKGIHNRLRSGIAIVAIQKKTGAFFGLGGEHNLQKPRLGISLDTGMARITKGKAPRQTNKPLENLVCNFRIVDGHKFEQLNDWKPDRIISKESKP